MALSVENLKKLEEIKRCYGVSYGKPVDFDSVYDNFRNSKFKRKRTDRFNTRSKTYMDAEFGQSGDTSLSYVSFDGRSVSSASTAKRQASDYPNRAKDHLEALDIKGNGKIVNKKHNDFNTVRQNLQRSRIDDSLDVTQNEHVADDELLSNAASRLEKTTRNVYRSRSFNGTESITKKRSVKFHDTMNIKDVSIEQNSDQRNTSILNATSSQGGNTHSSPSYEQTKNISQPKRDIRRAHSFCISDAVAIVKKGQISTNERKIQKHCLKNNTTHRVGNLNVKVLGSVPNKRQSSNNNQNDSKYSEKLSSTSLTKDVTTADQIPEVKVTKGIERSRSLYNPATKPKISKRASDRVYDQLNLDTVSEETLKSGNTLQNISEIAKDIKTLQKPQSDRHFNSSKHIILQSDDSAVAEYTDVNERQTVTSDTSDKRYLSDIKRPKTIQRSKSLYDPNSKSVVVKRRTHAVSENLNIETVSTTPRDAIINSTTCKSYLDLNAFYKTQNGESYLIDLNKAGLISGSTDVKPDISIQKPDIDFILNNSNETHNRYTISKESGLANITPSQELITVTETGVNGYIKLPIIAEEMGDGRVAPGDLQRIREDATGHLLCWGCGEFGQHGHGYKKQVGFIDGAIEMFCDDPSDIAKHVSCGSSHTAVVTANNEIYLWGNGNSGQLGSSDFSTKLVPTKVSLYVNQEKAPNIRGISCGGRHTMVLLENGHVFSFGNNYHAQLGYDFRQKNYKENQKKSDCFWDDDDDNVESCVAQPTLLKVLTHRAVVQVACGDKHSVFRFKDGGVACVGNNAHGQIGTDNRDDALVPKFQDTFTQHMVHIAAGSQHTLAVTEDGEMYAWGYGKACGSKKSDILSPIKMSTSRRNVIMVAGGSTHSMALTSNGSVYTWGGGHDGQLGHGDKVRFATYPRRIKDRHIYSKCVHIACGENFSAAITEKGLLYMWGKNSHTIMPNKPTTYKIVLPYGVNKNFRGGRLTNIFCGSWHAVALIGRPELLLRDGEESGESDSENVPTQEEVDAIFKDSSVSGDDDSDDVALPNMDIDLKDIPGRISRREDSKLEREKTAVSLADFYAPTPDLKNPRSPSPEFYHHNSVASDEEPKTDRAGLNTSRSATLIVQLPVQPMTTYADAACSPMTLTTTSSMKSSSVTTSSRVPSPIQEIPVKPSSRASKGILKPEKKFKEFDPAKYEKEKLRITTPVMSEVVQFSRTSADAFTLPREHTGLARKHVDFSEMEEIRLKGPKSPERLSRGGKRRERREASTLKYRDIRELSPTKLKEPLSSRARMRPLDSSLSHKSDSALMESPLFRTGPTRSVSSTDQAKKPWNVNSPDEDRQYRHHVPKQLPKKYKPPRSSESNFGLQISRSKTIVTPLQTEGFESPDRLAQIRRYAAVHNPQSTSGRGMNEKLKPIKPRQASIPTGRVESPMDEADQLFIGSLGGSNKQSISGPTWRDRSDFDKVNQPRKVAAGIVRMYITNNELTGGVDNHLYSTFSDGRGQGDPLLDGDPFIVQPLLKKKVPKLSDGTPSLQLPDISNTHNSNASLKEITKRTENKIEIDAELETNFNTTPRLDVVDSRVG